MPKKKKKTNKSSKLIYLLFFLLSTITVGIVLFLKVLPTKYSSIIFIIYLILNLIFGVTLLKKSKKSKKLLNFICILFILLFSFILYYLSKTINFMDQIKALKYQTDNYYVLVLKDSDYETISDINGKSVGTYSFESDSYNEALEKLNDKVDVKIKDYIDILKLGRNLLNGNIEVIFINESFMSMITDQITNFENKIKIIDTIKIKVSSNVEVNNIDVTKEPFNIYISGIDIYGDISSVSRSDVNMIVTINPITHKILLTSIPRDYYVRLHGTTGYKDKLTHAGIYGINMSIQTIEDLLEVDIDYYVRVNFTTLIKLVDSIGGITIDSDLAFTAFTDKNCKYVKGLNNLNGACALAFARERYAYESGDRHRVQNQQAVLTAILNKTLSSKTLITKYTSILKSLSNSFQTNMPTEKIYSLVNKQLDEMPSWDIEQISLNGKDSYNYTYSYSTGKSYVMEPIQDTIITAVNKINEVEGN